MVKHVEAAGDVIKPLVTARVGVSKVSSRMVRFGRGHCNILLINCISGNFHRVPDESGVSS